jgi:hypothetical protein
MCSFPTNQQRTMLYKFFYFNGFSAEDAVEEVFNFMPSWCRRICQSEIDLFTGYLADPTSPVYTNPISTTYMWGPVSEIHRNRYQAWVEATGSDEPCPTHAFSLIRCGELLPHQPQEVQPPIPMDVVPPPPLNPFFEHETPVFDENPSPRMRRRLNVASMAPVQLFFDDEVSNISEEQ